MKTTAGQPQGQRQLRVGEQLRQALSELMAREHFRDPDLNNTSQITVTEVRISPDLKNATAYVMPLGGINSDVIVTALNRAANYLRVELGRSVHLRFTPRLAFEIDTTFDQVDRLEELLKG